MRASVVTLGCPKNLVDSEHLLGVLGRAGFELTAFPAEADVVVINTCGFLQSAVAESMQEIRRYLRYKQTRGVRVVVAGCLVQRMSERLRRLFPEVDAFIGIDHVRMLPAILRHPDRALRIQRPGSVCGADVPRLLSTPSHYAYLRIADGCDNCCSYCLIPGIRGRFRSRTIPDLVREAQMLARGGVKELVLIAQDTTLYGQDRGGRKQLARLLRCLSRTSGLEWLRVMYTHPAHYTEELLDELAVNPRVVKYVDLPLQHVSDRILRKMNRGYTRSEVDALLARLRQVPDMSIRTTFIAGYPGESAAEFGELLQFVNQGYFRHVGCFPYSPEPGTRAQRAAGQHDAQTRNERAQAIMSAQRRVAQEHNRRQVGRIVQVRIDTPGKRPGEFLGRTPGDAPEIDNLVHITGQGIAIGSLVEVRVTRAGPYDLHAVRQRK